MKKEDENKGDIVNIDGRKIGRKDGIVNYKVGKSRGIGVEKGEDI